MKSVKGSFTIEATILIPLILFMMIGVLQIGLDFYKKSVTRQVSEEISQWDAVSSFYGFWLLKEMGEVFEDE